MADDTLHGIPDAWVTTALAADIAGFRASRATVWQSPTSAQVRRIATAVLQLERERIAAELRRLASDAAAQPPTVPGIERDTRRDTYLAAAQVALHGQVQERSDENGATHGQR